MTSISLVIISGSPVEGSSTDILLDRVAEAIRSACAATFQMTAYRYRLNNLDFKPCQSCGEAPSEGFCLIQDDLAQVYDHLAEADCVLLGSPVYFDSVSAQTKALVDRCNCFRPPDWANVDPEHGFVKILKRQRPGAMVLVGGERGWFEGARRVLAGWFRWLEIVNEGTLTYQSPDYRLVGSAAGNGQVLDEADVIGRHLASKIAESRGLTIE